MKKLKAIGAFVILAALLTVCFAFMPATKASANDNAASEGNEARVHGSAPYAGQGGTASPDTRYHRGTQTPNTTPNTTLPNGVTPNTPTPNAGTATGMTTPNTATPNTGIRRGGAAGTDTNRTNHGADTNRYNQGSGTNYYNNYTTNNYTRRNDMDRSNINRTDAGNSSDVIYLPEPTQTQTYTCEPEVRTMPFENGCIIIVTYCGRDMADSGMSGTSYNAGNRLNTYGANSGLNTYNGGTGYNSGRGYMRHRGFQSQTAPQTTNYGGTNIAK